MANTTSKLPGEQPSELEQLRRDNAQLRAQLVEANAHLTPAQRPKPHRPSFGLSEGERADLQMNGKTNSPFTGEPLTRDDL